jgi:hypothetical protein
VSQKNQENWQEVKLSAKVFGHISQGLYRTPAAAIKELISNAFDADSPTVRIHTAFPRFDTFSCQDAGNGISRHEFDRLMEKGVGSSTKRTSDNDLTPVLKRSVIGRLGIGLLALAQICTEFDIESHSKKGDAFRATMRFPAYTREEIDKLKLRTKDDLIPGGQYRVEEIDYDAVRKGVSIFTQHLRQGYKKRMRDLNRYAKFRKFKSKAPYADFNEFLTCVYDDPEVRKSLNLGSDYDQLIFGIALLSPLPYLDKDYNVMNKLDFFSEMQERLVANAFDLTIDNMNIRRPLKLPSDSLGSEPSTCKVLGDSRRVFELEDGVHKESVTVTRARLSAKASDATFNAYQLEYNNSKVGGRPLSFSGYLFQQTGRLYPREIQGVLVRIRGVAIGTYDAAFMTYPLAEGPRYSMVSCELTVHKGFEDALNIDRESFNTLDPHYLRMQAYLHSFLHTVVFPEAWGEEKKRNQARRTDAQDTRRERFLEFVQENIDERIQSIDKVEDDMREGLPVEFRPEEGKIVLHTEHPLLTKARKRKKYSEVVDDVAIIFEKALQERKVSDQRRVFYELLAEVFKNQP